MCVLCCATQIRDLNYFQVTASELLHSVTELGLSITDDEVGEYFCKNTQKFNLQLSSTITLATTIVIIFIAIIIVVVRLTK